LNHPVWPSWNFPALQGSSFEPMHAEGGSSCLWKQPAYCLASLVSFLPKALLATQTPVCQSRKGLPGALSAADLRHLPSESCAPEFTLHGQPNPLGIHTCLALGRWQWPRDGAWHPKGASTSLSGRCHRPSHQDLHGSPQQSQAARRVPRNTSSPKLSFMPTYFWVETEYVPYNAGESHFPEPAHSR
jgi:hypothetical protein